MDRCHDETHSEVSSQPDDSAIRRRIMVRKGLVFDVATEAQPKDPISRTLAQGIFPPLCRPLVELVETLVPSGGRVLDLGSHIGTFALAIAASGRDVLAVEASPRNFALLSASRRANRFDNLRLVHAAVSDRPGTLRFFANGPFGYITQGETHADAVEVPAITADDLLAQVGWERVDFIKIDIEGSEVAGLVGMSRLLTAPDAPPLFIESNGHTLSMFHESPSSLKAALAAFGYHLFQVEDRRLIPIELDEYQGTTVVDYLAVKTPLRTDRAWRVDRPMPAHERLRRARASCLSPFDDERLYAARAIGQAPEIIRTDRRIVRAVEMLKTDANSKIRQAASTLSFTARPRPWYAFWRR